MNDATPAAKAPRFLFIDALRGIAALMVVLFHASTGRHIDGLLDAMPAPLRFFFVHGDQGVTIFFVVSGFVIANTLIPLHVTPRVIGVFMLRRSIRLDPPYWASMVLAVIAAVAAARLVPGKELLLPSMTDVVLHVLYLPGLMQTPYISSIYWTLCLEIQFYLVFAALMGIVTIAAKHIAKERALDVILWSCVAFASLWPLNLVPFFVPGLFTDTWFMFLGGVLAWRATTRKSGDVVPIVAAVVNIIVLIIGAFRHDRLDEWVVVATLSVVTAVGVSGKATTWLSARPFQFLGSISYSLYLIHNVLTGSGFRVVGKVIGHGGVARELCGLVIVIAACIIFAWLFHKAIEAPSMALAKRIGRRH